MSGALPTNDTADKRLVSKFIKNIQNSAQNKVSIQIKKWANDLNKHFSKHFLYG